MYNLTRGLSVTAIGIRQPYVTLWRKPQGASARKTIFLDYQYQGGILGARLMFRNKHWSILLATILTFLTSIALIPLSSHVLDIQQILFSSTVQTQYNLAFNQSILADEFDLSGALDIASAITLFQATPPPWMDHYFAYQPFTVPHAPGNGNVSVETTAYSALLDCNVITPDEYTLDAEEYQSIIKFTDRGCFTTQTLANNLAHFLFSSYSEEECAIAAQYSRIGLFAAIYNNASESYPSALTVMSCEPSYWLINGTLTVNLNGDNEPVVLSFLNNSAWELDRPIYWTSFEEQLTNYAVVGSPGTITGDELGRKLYSYALKNSPQNPLDPNTLKDALEKIFPAVHAGILTTLFTSSPQTTGTGTLTSTVYRLFIILWTAAVSMVLILFNLLCNIWILVLSRRYPSILAEEPRGLLANTALAYDSRPDAHQPGIYSAIERFKAQYPAESTVREKMEKDYDIGKLECYFDRESWTIRLKNLPGDDDSLITSANLASRDDRVS
jgi:hypothetical protein